ncbi:hypothetical protein XENTR_v10002878 [Xenopus tropicalis]|nr:hypothetical protein XENTR_v10002878 [Xenopus tropicalis]
MLGDGLRTFNLLPQRAQDIRSDSTYSVGPIDSSGTRGHCRPPGGEGTKQELELGHKQGRCLQTRRTLLENSPRVNTHTRESPLGKGRS